MPNYICTTCGVEYGFSFQPPEKCLLCEDERQYVNWEGQTWTTLDALKIGHDNTIKPVEAGLFEIGTQPGFAIGQRALLVQSSSGNILWDCTCLVGQNIKDEIYALGGISAIAISHPHFYSTMIAWSKEFGGVPVYLHSSDRQWVMRPDPVIQFWSGEQHELGKGLKLVRIGSHFDGSTIFHWEAGAEGRGVIMAGDMPQVVSDRRYLSFMRSYPNLIPVNSEIVNNILRTLEPLAFDRIYGGWFDRVISQGAKEAIRRSAYRYLHAIQGSMQEK
jgi:hypothetical protein